MSLLGVGWVMYCMMEMVQGVDVWGWDNGVVCDVGFLCSWLLCFGKRKWRLLCRTSLCIA